MNPPLIVYYNGDCPICGAEVRHYRSLAKRTNAELEWVDISREPDALHRHGIDGEGAKKRLYALDPDIGLVSGVEAFARLWERLPRYRPLGRLARHRVVRPLAEWLYNGVLAPALYRYTRWRETRRVKNGAAA